MSPEKTLGPGLLSLLSLALAYLLWRTLAADSWFLASGTLMWLGYVLIVVMLVGPLLWLADRRAAGHAPALGPVSESCARIRSAPLVVAALVLLADLLLLNAPNLAVHASLEFNWQGKIVALAVMLVFVALWPGLSRRGVGFTVPGWAGWWPALLVTGAAALFWAAATSEDPPLNVAAEALLFQATMPSLEEEVVWRGILWAFLLQALPRTRRFGGQGWALLVSTLGFALIHGMVLDAHLSLTVDVPLFAFSGIAGLALGWIRIRSGSILPAMAAHSGINLSALIVPVLLR